MEPMKNVTHASTNPTWYGIVYTLIKTNGHY